ncbi:hypothetical protein PAXRUDRAFT_821269 [Paxillus rubicundulus Ve08.2h10]|uniref:F-box domain-containing protein n=1 Tax=Paxillus rubicundulus Ve08.2h10 TaxID=930991 RepID=A0A0D0E6R9_9AGAM|nr:hypothetical protein PAXRUDRAFT_821269 [Paxillus rubicundulus Ve08.2h10]
MAPRKRFQPETAGAAQAPDDNAKKRGSLTRVAKRKRVQDANDAQDTQDGAPLTQAKSKRQRWSRVAGRLAGLMEMPMDILFEIFGHLMPLDVLRLARTTKQFRRVLMHRSSLSIWIAARKNVPDFPDCPPYMSEPEFANLVFDTHCHECLSPNIRSVDWRIGRRICSKCAKECMVDDYSVFSGESVYKAVPSKYGKRGRPSYYSKDLQEFQRKRAAFTSLEERDEFVKERQDLVFKMETHGALLEGWAINQAKDRSEQLDDLRRERKEAIVEKLTELGWGPEIEQIPYRDDLSHHRLVKQPTRLTTRIWANIQTEMISYMEQMKTQRLERERKALVISRKKIAVSILRAYKIAHLPLTDVMPEPVDFCAIPRVSEILELPTETQVTELTFAPVVEKMDELVAEWRDHILGSLVQKVKDSLYSKPKVNYLGEDADLALLDSVATISSADPKGKGKAKAVDPPVPDDSEIIQNLSLATTVFNCKCCSSRLGALFDVYDEDEDEDDFLDPWGFGLAPRRRRAKSNPLFFPKVMGHRCLTKQRGFNWDNPGGDPTRQLDGPMGNRTQWTCQPLQLDEKADRVVVSIVTTCGLDPATTTTVQMDQLNPQLACLSCLRWSDDEMDEADASVFGWRTAVIHNNRAHAGRTNVKWKLIDEVLAGEVVNVDEQFKTNKTLISALVLHGLVPGDININPPEEAIWLCAHCLDLPQEKDCMEFSKIKTHLSLVHLVHDPQENQDYYEDYEAPQGRKVQHTPHKITLTMERPDDVPAPGERHIHDSWCFGLSGDEFEDDNYGDDYIY